MIIIRKGMVQKMAETSSFPSQPTDPCTLCPRSCGVSRKEGRTGFCGSTSEIRIARAALHMWEEPCISGLEGSGTVFFTGCSLRCVYCQNNRISGSTPASGREIPIGKAVSVNELSEIFLNLQAQGANNINLVTPDHFMPDIDTALDISKEKGLTLPVVCNCSGYESVESLGKYYKNVDIFLTDFKYMDSSLADRLSKAYDYPEVAKKALDVMFSLVGTPVFSDKASGTDSINIMKKGVIVRHLVLPGHKKNSKDVIKYIAEKYGDSVYLSIMNQYTPPAYLLEMPEFKDIARKVTKREYTEVVDFALSLGIENAFIQDGETASESFIPDFSV